MAAESKYKTPQLYDEGEEDWELKLHVECASIYLEGYKNVAPKGLHPYEKPELIEANKTTIDDYWGRKQGRDLHVEGIPLPEQTAVDLLSDMRKLPYVDQVDKIVCIQAFEHLTLDDARRALLNWWNALRVGGTVIISVPDPIATAQLLQFESVGVREWAIRHLMGDGINAYALHHWAYTEENLRKLLTEYGFTDIERLTTIHWYPSVILKARKADPFIAERTGYQPLPDFPAGWKILDIGPGNFPLPRATHFLDVKRFEGIPEEKLTEFDLNDLLQDVKLPFPDNHFDFVYCSHVLEHLESPRVVMRELERVGKRGFVEVPSICLDFMMKHGTSHEKWACWGYGNRILFIEKAREQNQLFLDWNRTWGWFFHHAVHGIRLEAIHRSIRYFFWKNQRLLNIQASWDKDEEIGPIEVVEIHL